MKSRPTVEETVKNAHVYEVRPRKDPRGVDLILSRQRACQLAVFFGKLPHENNRSIHCWFTVCHYCMGAGRSWEWHRVVAG